MRASAVFSAVPVTSARRDPEPLMVPAITRAPGSLRTGRDSPVIIDSFTSLEPSRTTPSAGMTAPGRTSTRSRSRRSKTATVSSRSPVIRTAVSGSSLASSLSAPCACEMDRISIQWPSTMIVTRVASSHHRSEPGNPNVTVMLHCRLAPGTRTSAASSAPTRASGLTAGACPRTSGGTSRPSARRACRDRPHDRRRASRANCERAPPPYPMSAAQ